MSNFFVDTSALGRRYLSEVGSAWVRSWITPASKNVILVSDLTSIEMFSVLARRQREKFISELDTEAARNEVLLHIEKEYLSVRLESDVLIQARELVGKHALRTLDAIQLSCALKATNVLGEAMVFVSADKNLLVAAAAEGFATDNPNLHP